MNKTKLVHDIGIYEKGRYSVLDDQRNKTTEYRLWQHMLGRCQPGGVPQKHRPTYIGCSVHPDFIKFQDFAEWCQTQIGFGNDGWALDKDIIVQGNKVYGPDTCCFVPKQMNTLFIHKRKNQGDCPTGVYYFKANGCYRAQLSINGKVTPLGSFDTPEAAEIAYKAAKSKESRRQAEIWKDQLEPKVYQALIDYQF